MIDMEFFEEEGLGPEARVVSFSFGEQRDDIRIKLIEYLDQSGIYQVGGLALKIKGAARGKPVEGIRYLESFEALVDLIEAGMNDAEFMNIRVGIHFYNNRKAVMFVAKDQQEAPQPMWIIRKTAHAG